MSAEPTAAERARASCARQLEHHGHRYYVLDDPEIGDDDYDALLDELRAHRGRAPRARSRPTRRRSASAASRSRRSRRSRHLQPMLSLANARSEEELRAWVERMRNHLAREGIEDPAVRVRRRAEDRRPGDLAALRGRRARARRHARQRRGRRGRHAQPAHDRRDPAARSRTRRRCSRCAARSTCRCRTSPRSTSGAPRPGESTFMNPRNSAAGHDPPARPASSPPSGRCRCGPTAIGRAEGARVRRATGRRSSGCASTASASTATSCVLDSEDEVVAQCLALAGAPRRAGLRDRRRRREGRRRSSCSAAWASSAATRAGRSPGSSRRRRRSRRCSDDRTGTSASSATCTRSPCSSRCSVGGVTVKLATLHNEEDLAPQGRPRAATR